MSENEDLPKNESFSPETAFILTLEKLPTEIILHICNFLEAKFVSNVLSFVCQRFSQLLNDDAVWKSRMKDKWGREAYISIPGVEINWKEACVEREEQYLWHDESLVTCHTFPEIHFANVDCFKMLRDSNLLAAASRDRSFSIWNIETSELVHHEKNAHEGWIWCILGSDDKFFTGSWDSTIKSWDLNSFGNLNIIKCESNILCLAQDHWALFAGLFHKKIVSLDLREPNDTNIRTFNFHKRSVLDLAIVNDYHLASVSEDGYLNVVDWRMDNDVLYNHKFDDFPSCLSYQNNQLWIGDQGGSVHLINSKTYEWVLTHSKVHEKLITGIKKNIGGITTSSKDGSICMLQPTLEGKEITRICNPYKMEITGFEQYKNMLISSLKSGCDLTIWSPNPLPFN